MPTKKVHWKREPDSHDYPAAVAYLSMVVPRLLAEATAAELQEATIVTYKAKDILRASGLEVLPVTNVHVAKDLDKVNDGLQLSPVLLVRGDLTSGRALTIADGY